MRSIGQTITSKAKGHPHPLLQIAIRKFIGCCSVGGAPIPWIEQCRVLPWTVITVKYWRRVSQSCAAVALVNWYERRGRSQSFVIYRRRTNPLGPLIAIANTSPSSDRADTCFMRHQPSGLWHPTLIRCAVDGHFWLRSSLYSVPYHRPSTHHSTAIVSYRTENRADVDARNYSISL